MKYYKTNYGYFVYVEELKKYVLFVSLEEFYEYIK